MPVKIWDRSPEGNLISSIRTSRRIGLSRGEAFREEAEELDRCLDHMLDRAVELTSSAVVVGADAEAFTKRWALGRALAESNILESPHLEPDERNDLWIALARKCRLGIRATGEELAAWRALIPQRDSEPKKMADDYFSRGVWLQEQELESAILVFGGRLQNAHHLHNKGAIRSLRMRKVLTQWLKSLDLSVQAEITREKPFGEMTKVLAARWPARGPGSAKRPIHYSDEDLFMEISKVLTPVVERWIPEDQLPD